ncbi:NADPH-dependent 7-cyano-7-deazaguanine reductase QueF [Exilibacterium tricleocarpae]|uniref:NADPH-dependent 7-cyano-7-deazaguanine reductase n=1 Tax=Exilibacterium tricleocarpae TaxID=2591008 RepID=A0A545SMW3_9GAMM|nr:NADPH-dependent 7-cyano-7-deazaguanine reductase QueF [Exilibacterium tricleocarpae]TQV66294.1 NADPH-dependent 7-cyano-7-deazaguanine reductase QueF [Exilibacterium tricleocarpae]
MADDLLSSKLGKQTDYVTQYTPSLLFPITRQESRKLLGIEGDPLPFVGMDIWTAYEMSWLDKKGKPQVAIGEFRIPCQSPSIIESKSFKLYLNSLNQTRFDSVRDVISTLESDLSVAAGAPVIVQVTPLAQALQRGLGHYTGENLDQLDVEVQDYQPNPELLRCDRPDYFVHESLNSDLLKTNCPVTGQPDWASIYIEYQGAAIDREGLLKYIISFRSQQDFHEHCVERIFMDISARCQPQKLTVYARYTRRGGVDINPYRSNESGEPEDFRLVRQ